MNINSLIEFFDGLLLKNLKLSGMGLINELFHK